MTGRNPYWTDLDASDTRALESWRFPDGTLVPGAQNNGSISDSLGGTLTTSEITDFISVYLTAGETYNFVSVSSDYTTRLSIYDNQGYLMDFKDGGDYGIVESARSDTIIDFVPNSSGTYKLAVGFQYVPGSFGYYGVAVAQVPTQATNTVNGTAQADTLYGTTGDDVINGLGGDDILYGGQGNDKFDGGSGIDAVVIATTGTATIFTDKGTTRVTTASEGTDTLTNVELLVINGRVNVLDAPHVKRVEGGLFDENFYRQQNPDVDAAVKAGFLASGEEHFVKYGRFEGRDPHVLFDEDYYLSTNKDVADAVNKGQITAWQHFQDYGWREGRDPSAFFDTSDYLTRYGDVKAAGVNPLDHYLIFGEAEGRIVTVSSLSDLI
ncbi:MULTISPECIES: hypothetical protein [unclassified Azospirillum]|uniref:calcium-binding protein n=1 Tax=unclassified Azospirillum TaxID=2630922 RepID=UPI000B6D5639|nr:MULTISPECIES: hypothetical protein [unclassified Azospirillum]SNS11899.1 hypothetical protein SAMN05880556_10258 [Azospirillum sp. RU38E]SNS28771.1 hypothetical protein SAMN05880591_10258 [Azospirillum sp. RU37A]